MRLFAPSAPSRNLRCRRLVLIGDHIVDAATVDCAFGAGSATGDHSRQSRRLALRCETRSGAATDAAERVESVLPGGMRNSCAGGSCRGVETKYLVRMLAQNLRVGANWRSIVGALARAVLLHRCLLPSSPARALVCSQDAPVTAVSGRLCPAQRAAAASMPGGAAPVAFCITSGAQW